MSGSEGKVHCWIYRSTRWEETYLYLKEEDAFDDVPDVLLARLGRLEFVMELELHRERKLARADVDKVMQALEERGFFLQLPPLSDKETDGK